MKAEFTFRGCTASRAPLPIKEMLEETAAVAWGTRTYLNGKTAIVEFDDATVQQSTLIKKIQELGYQATVGEQQQKREAGA